MDLPMNKKPAIITPADLDYVAVSNSILALCGRYPFLKRSTLGKSVLGKDLHLLTLGEGPEIVLYAGAFHGMERLTTMLLLFFTEQLCRTLEADGKIGGIAVRKAFYGRTLALMPLVNPDGCDIALKGLAGAGPQAATLFKQSGGELHRWNANARGIDLNHNFNAGFALQREQEQKEGYHQPGPTRYGGTRPESEPESTALADFCRTRNVVQTLAFHSQGEEIYWRYGDRMPPRSAALARLLAVSSGYTLSEPEGIASHGGFKDWFIEALDRPGFTIEIGKGQNPLPPGHLLPIYDRLEEMLMLGFLL